MDMNFPASLFLSKKYSILANGSTASPMEKGEFIFPMAATFKAGSTRERLKAKIISSFMLMAHFIGALSATLKKMDSEGFYSTMHSSIPASGKMENLMAMNQFKSTLMAASTLVILLMASSKEKDSIFGLMEKFTLDNLKMVKCMAAEL